MSYSFCFLIPCYNHAETLPDILQQLESYGLDCLIIDDGSAPEHARLLDCLPHEFAHVEILRHGTNLGKGGAVMTGMRAAFARGFTHAIQIDADGQHDLNDLPTLLDLSRNHPDCLISGCPVFDESVPKSRLYGRYITHAWVWLETLSTTIRDSMCGFRAYPLTPCLSLINEEVLGSRMDFDVEVMVRLYWRGVRPIFFETRVIYPVGGMSHFRMLHDNALISWMHTRLFLGMLMRLPRKLGFQDSCRTHWSTTKERGTFLGLKFMLATYRIAGRGLFSLFLYPVMGYFWITGRQARTASEDYLDRVSEYASAAGRPIPANLSSFRHFLSFGHSALDKVAAWNGDIHLNETDFPNIELYRKVVSSGKGLLVIGSHLGNLELCRALGNEAGDVRINSIVHTHHAVQFNQVLESVNPQVKINLIQVSDMGPETAIMLEQKINAGEWVVIVADRTPLNTQKNMVWADFLGSKAAFPQGPFILASLLKCPVYLMFGLKNNDRYTIHFELFAEQVTLPRAERAKALASVVQKFARRLEHYCLTSPLEWFNFFDFWKGPDEKDTV